MENVFVSGILASIALLATTAIFRLRTHQELIVSFFNETYAVAAKIAYKFKDDVRIGQGTLSSQFVLTVLDHAIETLETDKLNTIDKSDTADDSKIKMLEKLKESINNLDKQTSEIRCFFNRPFYLVLFTLFCYFIIYNLKLNIDNKIFYVLASLTITFSWIRFYNLFNFEEEEKEGTHGFSKIRWFYYWILRPGNIQRFKDSRYKQPVK